MDLRINSTVDNEDGTWTYYLTACVEPDNALGPPAAMILSFIDATGIVNFSPAVLNAPGTTWNGAVTAPNEITWGSDFISLLSAQYCEDFEITIEADGLVPLIYLSDRDYCLVSVKPPQPNCDIVGIPSFTDLSIIPTYDCTVSTDYDLVALDGSGMTHFTDGVTIFVSTDANSPIENTLIITGSDGTIMEYGPSNTGINYKGQLPLGNLTITLTNIAPGTSYVLDWCDVYGDGLFNYSILYNGTGATMSGQFNHSFDYGVKCYQVETDPLGLDGEATFSGDGVVNYGDGTGSFNPYGLTEGLHTITYTYNNGRDCFKSISQDIIVLCTPCLPGWEGTSICADDAPIDLAELVTGDLGGAWSGTGVEGSDFNPEGLTDGVYTLTYEFDYCSESHDIIVNDADASWSPTVLCVADGLFDLNSLVTGDLGGAWSGLGVNGAIFNPEGQDGSIDISYLVEDNGCTNELIQAINVTSNPDASWQADTVCEMNGLLDLTSLEIGTNGGTWSGVGVTGTTFDPSEQLGEVSLTYSIEAGSCNAFSTQSLIVGPILNPAWDGSSVCETKKTIDLSRLIIGDAGGVWSGDSIVAAELNLDSLSNAVIVKYKVGKGVCADSLVQVIEIDTMPVPITNDTSICETSGKFDLGLLNKTVIQSSWSGMNVTNATFEPLGRIGDNIIDFSMQNGACSISKPTKIKVRPAPIAHWKAPADVVFDDLLTIDLNTLLAPESSREGVWSGEYVIDGQFNIEGLFGEFPITYEVLDDGCSSKETYMISVVGNYSIFFYNTFTPNGDELNEGFRPHGDLEPAENYVFRIFNRWGELIFQTYEKNEYWNGGKFNQLHKPLVNGMYIYQVDISNYKGEIENYTGSVLLLR